MDEKLPLERFRLGLSGEVLHRSLRVLRLRCHFFLPIQRSEVSLVSEAERRLVPLSNGEHRRLELCLSSAAVARGWSWKGQTGERREVSAAAPRGCRWPRWSWSRPDPRRRPSSRCG